MAAPEPLRPRLCRLVRGEQGYGFHLHGEKGRRGQFIRRVEPGSPAEAAALRAGDRLVEVNGVNVEGETHHQVWTPGRTRGGLCVCARLASVLITVCRPVVQRIKAVEGQTRLLVVDQETDEELRRRQLTCTEEMAQRGLPPAHDPWEPKPDWAHTGSRSSEAGKKDVSGPLRELRPRLCHLRKGPQGYGFNLHSDKSRPGQYIRSVDPGSPAAHSGLRAQDRLIEVNGQNVEGLRHAEVVASIKAREDEARLLVVDPETDEHFKRLRVTPTEEHVEGPLPSPVTNGTSPAQLNGGSACSSRSDLPGSDKDIEDGSAWKRDPFQESGLHLSPTAAEAKEKARATRVNKRAPQMDWNRKREIFSNF
nr:Na(+)/H(+) exchange regulatory cofactor NHE-RF2 isoform X1 [Gorilla gorilla gorilla]